MVTRGSTLTRLLDAVNEVVFVEGATHAPVDAILERAGVSPATLYRAYASKDALVAAALERRHEEWLAVWDAAIARASTDRDRLLAVFDALEEYAGRTTGARWCAFLGTAAGHVDPDPVLAAAVRLETDELRARLRRLAEPVVGTDAPRLVEALLLVYSGRLAMRLRAPQRGVGAPSSRAVAGLLIDQPDRLGS
ncbi:TetR/AcrR family transcriptional regulator [Nocardioides renjunii]|uniref:TetR/AcrR family transcriptional regulator n=1 Tax=Nocardioides renjunii TaxID=3095075 RepID=UPI002AFF9240|nr:TetR/AcrR family transcriptional regulator [Nocardioides sp. S-34]WQQ21076.1 TetR/AcrR family transcriptional regulator [Nocardioides sp. S-34]